MRSANGHLARLRVGTEARGKAALASMLDEAMRLLTQAAESGNWTEEDASRWADAYLALAQRYDGWKP